MNVQKLTNGLNTPWESKTGAFASQILKYTINLWFRDKQITTQNTERKHEIQKL